MGLDHWWHTSCIEYFRILSYRVAHCDVEQDTYDKLDVALKKVQEKSDEIKADVKESIDKKAAELWDIIKEKYITEHLNEAFSIIDEIMSK